MDGRHHTLAYPLLAAAVAMTLAPTLAGAITLTWSSGDFVTGITAPEPLTALDILEINSMARS